MQESDTQQSPVPSVEQTAPNRSLWPGNWQRQCGSSLEGRAVVDGAQSWTKKAGDGAQVRPSPGAHEPDGLGPGCWQSLALFALLAARVMVSPSDNAGHCVLCHVYPEKPVSC